MYKLKIYCNDGDVQYWEEGLGTYETYDKALIACYEDAWQEAKNLMSTSDYHNWFEVDMDFEITEHYETELLRDVTLFPAAVIHYDRVPWDRENDCDITIITGYYIVEVK